MRSFLYILLVFIVRFSTAIYCYDDRKEEHCCGDFCFIFRLKSPLDGRESFKTQTGCISGDIYKKLNVTCWNDSERSFCLCDGGNYCHDQLDYFPAWEQGKLTCGEFQKDCVACEQESYDDYYVERGCRKVEFEIGNALMRPQSCVRFVNDKYSNRVQCVCDTGSNCDRKLVKQQTLQSKKVTCLMGAKGDDTCKGDFCFITKPDKNSVYPAGRGCITNNETLYEGLFQPGYFSLVRNHMIMCTTDKCNSNWQKAKKYVTITEPTCTVESSTTQETTTRTSRSEIIEQNFRSEWRNLIHSITKAFHNVIADLTRFH